MALKYKELWRVEQVFRDLNFLQEIIINDNGKKLAIRSQCLVVCGKVFQVVGVAIPKTIREIT